MDTQEALVKVRELMDGHGLSDWDIRLDRAIRRFGSCVHRSRQISLSRHLTLLNGWDEVKDTALHEIAHALAGASAGHGPKWQALALHLGGSAGRCFDQQKVRTPAARYRGTCPNCGVSVLRNRRQKCACRNCCRTYADGKFDARFRFVWGKNNPVIEEARV
jgi:predicted SprT family Zn-dependent metalloprotease